ncbi:hypothetical protein GCM10009555_107710 [Acrocarpospora macrocephala]|uniref:Polyketide cyclase n=1 Tax=Acrocarpospora macrocephala TaxID=150177 RepID=A0A5M3XFX2_9ACTN|nr:SRPBCC family protein [Acrocarpospora macrocephala]GES16988.1 hypothetical protein Amac_105860 [Acrocarpospora macrocephala]
MKRAFEVSTVIDRPIAAVWRELTDWERAPRWMKGVESMHADPGTEVGATLVFRARGKTRKSGISALEPGRSLTLTSEQGNVTARYSYVLEGAGDRTRARLTADVEVRGFPWTLLGPLIRAAIRRTDSRQLADFRAVAEAGGPR